MSELDKLEAYLKKNGYEYERIDEEDESSPFNRHQIIVYKDGKIKWDAICQYGSFGYYEGLLEIYGELVSPRDGDSVVGHLKASQVIRRIKRREKGR